MTGEHLQEQRRVERRAGHRPHVIEGRRQRDDAAERNTPVRRHEPRDPGPVRGAPDGPAGVAPEGARSQAAGQRRRRAHAGAAREPRRVPGVPGRPVVIRVQRPVGELGRVGLPEDDRAGFPEPGHDAGVLVGHEAREHLGPPGRALAPGPAEVLDGHRHAVERTPRAAGGQLALGEARLAEDPLGVERDERVQRRARGAGSAGAAPGRARPARATARRGGGRGPRSRETRARRRSRDALSLRESFKRSPAELIGRSPSLEPRRGNRAGRSRSRARGARLARRRPAADRCLRRSSGGPRRCPPVAALTESAVEDDLDAGRLAEAPPEVLVELLLITAHDDENAPGGRPRRQLRGGIASPSTTLAPGIRRNTSGAMRILPFRPPVPTMTQSRSSTRAST